MIDIAAVPLGTLWNLTGSGANPDTTGAVVVSRQGQIQILIVTVQHLSEISGPGPDIDAGIVEGLQPINAQVPGGAGPLNLHQPMTIAVGFRPGIEI